MWVGDRRQEEVATNTFGEAKALVTFAHSFKNVLIRVRDAINMPSSHAKLKEKE